MTKYLDKTFSVALGQSKEYRDGWAATFGGKAGKKKATKPKKSKKAGG